MPSPLGQHPRNRLPIPMHNSGPLPPLQLPPGGANPKAKIRITPRPNSRLEAADLLARHPPHRRIRRLRKRPLVMSQRDVLAHRRLQPRIPRSTRALRGARLLIDNGPRKHAHASIRQRLEVPRQQIRRRKNIRIKKDEPLGSPEGRRPIAGVIRGLQLSGPEHPHRSSPVAVAGARPVVGHDHAVASFQIKPLQPLENDRKLRIRPPKRKHDINRRPRAHSPNLRRASSSPPRLPILAVPWGRSSVG